MSWNAEALPQLVDTPQAFEELKGDLSKQRFIGVDTESNSLHAFRERVCLMQFSTIERDYVLDVLRMEDVSGIGPILADPNIEKIFHAAEYDIICLRRDYGFTFYSIFDTMQAGRILGRKLAGLDRLIEDKFGVKVSKRLQKADWGRRPLSPELLQYAAQDTHYLIPLRNQLEAELREKGLLELALEDFRMACVDRGQLGTASEAPPAWTRLSGRRDLTPQELTILKELVEWRQQEAERLDRPPFKVLSDEILIEVARNRPAANADLAALDLGERALGRWGGELLAAVARGLRAPLVQRRRAPMPSAAYLKRLEDLRAWRKKMAERMQVESDVVLPRGMLLALAERGEQGLDQVLNPSPWRRDRFGEEISAVVRKTAIE